MSCPAFAVEPCGLAYPEIAGVPRFAGESYVASFGRQWNRYDVARDEEDEAVFTVKTGIHPHELAGKLVLDAGCGGGRYARLLGRFGARVVGVDLSSAVQKARALCSDFPDVTILQGDLTELPLADGISLTSLFPRSACYTTARTRGARPSTRSPNASNRAGQLAVLALSQKNCAAARTLLGLIAPHFASTCLPGAGSGTNLGRAGSAGKHSGCE